MFLVAYNNIIAASQRKYKEKKPHGVRSMGLLFLGPYFQSSKNFKNSRAMGGSRRVLEGLSVGGYRNGVTPALLSRILLET